MSATTLETQLRGLGCSLTIGGMVTNGIGNQGLADANEKRAAASCRWRPGKPGERFGHIIGPHASIVIQQMVAAVRLKMTTDELARVVYAHPALPELIENAVLDF